MIYTLFTQIIRKGTSNREAFQDDDSTDESDYIKYQSASKGNFGFESSDEDESIHNVQIFTFVSFNFFLIFKSKSLKRFNDVQKLASEKSIDSDRETTPANSNAK